MSGIEDRDTYSQLLNNVECIQDFVQEGEASDYFELIESIKSHREMARFASACFPSINTFKENYLDLVNDVNEYIGAVIEYERYDILESILTEFFVCEEIGA